MTQTSSATAASCACRSSPPPFAGDSFSCKFRAGRKAYVPGVVDFFAIHVVPIDYCYIISFAAVSRTAVSLQFNPQKQGHRYECYLEAWNLLRE
jgi:hypothetical protein